MWVYHMALSIYENRDFDVLNLEAFLQHPFLMQSFHDSHERKLIMITCNLQTEIHDVIQCKSLKLAKTLRRGKDK